MNRQRRHFLKTGAHVALGAASVSIPAQTGAQISAEAVGEHQGVRSYRRLGRTDLNISDISFGASRLRSDDAHLVHHALDRGINYFDSAESYTRGQSETVLGQALKGRRQSIYLVSKTGINANTRAPAMMRNLEASLGRLQTDYVDVYMNHAVNSIDAVASPEWQSFIDRAKTQGKVRFSGLSGHAGRLIECIDYALDEDLIDVMLVGYNFGQDPAFYEGLTRAFDRIATLPDLPRVIAKAKKRDVGVIAMKTLMGARLNDMRPYEKAGAGTFSQAAFSWVLANPDVDALIISMTSTDKINEYLGASGQPFVSHAARNLLNRYAKLNGANYCRHACNLCSGACPADVPIADVLRTRMYATDYGDTQFARNEYALLANNASACLSCSGEPCQNACPNGIQINQLCRPTHQMLQQQLGEVLT